MSRHSFLLTLAMLSIFMAFRISSLWSADPPVNYDEAKIPAYELPDALKTLAGASVDDATGIARLPRELVEWTIGPVRLVSIPGEAFHALGRAIETRVGEGTHVLLAGLAPVWHGYLPSPFGDGYEEATS